MGITALFLLSVLGFAITAEAQSCSKPVGEANMSLKDDFIIQDTFVNGAVVSFACNPGYTSAGGSSKITCSAGVWSPVQLRCERKNCGALEDVNNGYIEYRNGTEFGDTAVVICNQGYIPVGQSVVIRCYVNGWIGRLPVCEAVQCVTPAGIVNGTFSPEKEFYSYRDVVRYSCNKDVILNGSGELTCSKDGTFHPAPPTCVWVECKDPVIENAEFVEGSRPPHRYGASVKYSCKPGYVIEGTSTLMCLLNSQWSSPLPKCTKDRGPTMPTTTTPTTTTATPTPDNGNGLSPGIIVLIVIIIFFIIIITVFIYRKKRARGSSTVKEAAKDDEDIALS
ncbi:membrane cofactor protein-like isoform X2 [Girardinichthys multiradiatus]|uniref:membrane cofactor protein-like isoform X2 n=1 Tax=Girardinichthys multiradiatus TaxID=208333 RepID=UPI001FACCAE8|nr:membrane cofactor protein-like isoform X2 [Girardinichthys multiradiatus]